MRRALIAWACSLAAACTFVSDLDQLEGTADAAAVGAGQSGADGSAGTGGDSNACSASCDRLAAAGCKLGTFSGCVLGCSTQSSALPPECLEEWGALLLCSAQQGSYICTSAGVAQLVNCLPEQEQLDQCLSGTGGSSGSGGSGGSSGSGGVGGASGGGSGFGGSGGGSTGGGGSGGTCTAPAQTVGCTPSNPNACEACMFQKCCGPINECFATTACAGAYQCLVDNCTGASDVNQCAEQLCGACDFALYAVWTECVVNNCATECTL